MFMVISEVFLADLIKPSTLVPSTTQRMQEHPFYFHLTPQQATDIASSRDIRPGVKCDYVKQVQLRFCLLETTCPQEDCFPPQVIVKVNNKLCPLPVSIFLCFKLKKLWFDVKKYEIKKNHCHLYCVSGIN